MSHKPWLCAAGVTLKDQINRAYPERDKRSDGWVADARHLAGGKSDHIPDASCSNVVRAIDVDRDLHGVPKPVKMPYLADQLRLLAKSKKDGGRIAYLIFNGFIASPKKSWSWREYVGANQHRHHLHCSFTSKGDKDGSPFQIPLLQGE
jgi:hypothetical protein